MTAPDHFAKAELNTLRRRGPPTYDFRNLVSLTGADPKSSANLDRRRATPFSMRDPSPGSIILLNGASSAGKSTLARALQAQLEEPFLCFSLDLFLFDGKVLPKRRDHDGPYSWPVMRPLLFEGYFRCLAALAGAGNNLIVDYIIETHDQMNRLASLTAPFDVFYVGVDCPLPELERRERERGDRKIGDARRDHANFQNFRPV